MNGLHELHIDVGCYVADALDTDERAAFEAHLDHCESCSREVVEFSETSAELARLVAMAPPRAIRGSMLSAIQSVRPLPPLTVEVSRGTLTLRRSSVTWAPSSCAEPVGGPTDRLPPDAPRAAPAATGS